MLKKSMAMILVISMMFYSNILPARAEEEEQVIISNSSTEFTLEGNNNEGILAEKLEYDADNDVTDLDPSLEEELNEAGVFDSEIENFDDDTIEKIEDAVNVNVSVDYLSVDDKTGEKSYMSLDEVNSVIEEKIDDGEMDYEPEDDGNVVEDLLSSCGIIPVEVEAATTKTSRDSKESPSHALKFVLVCSQTSKGGKIFVTYTATWIKEAKYRSVDVAGVFTNDIVTIDTDSISCNHWATHTTKIKYVGIGGEKTVVDTETLHTHPKTHKWDVNGVAYSFNLFGDRAKMNATQAAVAYSNAVAMSTYGSGELTYIDESYSNEFVSIKFTCKITDKSNSIAKFCTRYFHAKTNVSLSPSIGVSSTGICVSVSGTATEYYQDVSDNAFINYKYI